MDGDGRLLLLRAGETRLEQSACLVLTKEVMDPRSRVPALVGDILLTRYDAVDTPVMRQQLRKLDGLGE